MNRVSKETKEQRMAPKAPEWQAQKPQQSALQWLLDSDPSIRWQVMRDLTDEPAEVVDAEWSRVASQGWGARLLGQQRPDGNWGDGIATPHWRSNLYRLLLLRALGLDPTSTEARTAVGLVRDQVTWCPEFGNSPFFEGEVEPCINGGVLALGGYFGQTSDRLVDRLLGEQLTDGGWTARRSGAPYAPRFTPRSASWKDSLSARRPRAPRRRSRRRGPGHRSTCWSVASSGGCHPAK